MIICLNPFVKNGVGHGCGQCLPCRVNKRRQWTSRIKLEALCHQDNAFLTLTYAQEHLPTSTSRSGGFEIPTLNPKDLQDWLKRLREAHQPLKLRFFAVGEYGDDTHRPHYHVVLFNFRGCLRSRTRRAFGTSKPDPANCCDRCRLVLSTWPKGNIELGELNAKTASYVAAYTVKKLTAWDDRRLDGQHPEFARMSLRPGIGHDSLWEYAHTLLHFSLDSASDVPNAYREGSTLQPLGRYLRGKLREKIGKENKAPETTIKEMAEEMRPLREAAFDSSTSLKSAIIENSRQRAADLQARLNIRKKGKPL